MLDGLAGFIRRSPGFRGKPRLIKYWMEHRETESWRTRLLSASGSLRCDLSVPYEAMVWLCQEEEMDLASLRRLLRSGDTFIDCGANIGLWTVTAAEAVGSSGAIHAFEPNPEAFGKLSHNVRILAHVPNLGRVYLQQAAVSESSEPVLLECDPQHNISRVVDVAGERTSRVPAIAIDDVLGGRVVHGMKLDIEGHELVALKGAERTITEWKPWLIVEFNTTLAGVNVIGDWDVFRWLSPLGYTAERAQGQGTGAHGTSLPSSWKIQGYTNILFHATSGSVQQLPDSPPGRCGSGSRLG